MKRSARAAVVAVAIGWVSSGAVAAAEARPCSEVVAYGEDGFPVGLGELRRGRRRELPPARAEGDPFVLEGGDGTAGDPDSESEDYQR